MGGFRTAATSNETVDQVVDIRKMVVDVSTPEHRKPAVCNAPEQLEETPVAWAVNSGRSDDGHLDSELRADLSGAFFTLEFRDLVNVSRSQWSILVGWWSLDVAMHAYRAAVHHSTDTGPRGRFDNLARSRRVDSTVHRSRYAGLSVDSRDVVHDVDVANSHFNRRRVTEISADHLDSQGSQVAGSGRITDERAHRAAAIDERPRQVTTSEAGRPGYEVSHRSATSVTGDPKSRRAPIR